MKYITRKLSTGLAATFLCAAAVGTVTIPSAYAQTSQPDVTSPNGEVRREFAYPLDNVQLTYNGVTYTLDGSLSGTAGVREDGSGGVHVRARINGDDLNVTLPDGTTYQGRGTGNLVANVRAPQGETSFFTALTKINLTQDGDDDDDASDLKLQLQVRGRIDTENNVTLAVTNARIISDSDDDDESGREVRSTFSYPLDGVQFTYGGATYTFDGVLSGISSAKAEGEGIIKVRTRIKSDDLSVVTSDGRAFEGVGISEVETKVRAVRTGDAVFDTVARVRLVDANGQESATLLLRLRGAVDPNGQVSYALTETRISNESSAPEPTGEVRSNFSYPLEDTELTYDGVTYVLNGEVSGIPGVRRDGSGGVHIRGIINTDNLSVTLPDGTTYQGAGTANIVANARAPRGGTSTFNAITNIRLLSSDGNSPANAMLQVRVKGIIDANYRVVLTITDARVVRS